jgi:hypothetical protein
VVYWDMRGEQCVLSRGAAFDAVVAVMSGLNLSMTPVHVPPGPHVTSQRRQWGRTTGHCCPASCL